MQTLAEVSDSQMKQWGLSKIGDRVKVRRVAAHARARIEAKEAAREKRRNKLKEQRPLGGQKAALTIGPTPLPQTVPSASELYGMLAGECSEEEQRVFGACERNEIQAVGTFIRLGWPVDKVTISSRCVLFYESYEGLISACNGPLTKGC